MIMAQNCSAEAKRHRLPTDFDGDKAGTFLLMYSKEYKLSCLQEAAEDAAAHDFICFDESVVKTVSSHEQTDVM